MSQQEFVASNVSQFDPITQKLIQTIANQINRTTGIVDGAKLSISSQKTAFYVYCSPTERRICHESLIKIEEDGLLECSWHPQVIDDFETLRQITIPFGKKFLETFGVKALADTVSSSSARLRALRCGVDWIDYKVREISERWRVGANYLLLGPKDIALVEIGVTVAQRLAAEPINGRDATMLSLDWFGDPDVIDKNMRIIAMICESQIAPQAKDLEPKFQMASLGIQMQTSMFYFRGPLTIKHADDFVLRGDTKSQIGVVLDHISDVEVGGEPPYLLTIQSYRTYQRYVNAVADDGVVLYMGDFPNKDFLAFYEKVTEILPSATPIFHWGDVDLSSYRAITTLQDKLFGREVQPFQMGVDAMSYALPCAELIDALKLRQLSFSHASKGALKSALKELNSLPPKELRIVKQDCMVMRPPAVRSA